MFSIGCSASEALARLHCDAEIQPSYVREAFRLLKTSIIQVETSDVDVEEDDDEEPGAAGVATDGPNDDDDDDDHDDNDPMDQETPAEDEPETQAVYHPGEYGAMSEAGPVSATAQQQQQQKKAASDDSAEQQPGQGQEQKSKKRSKKKKTKISFEEYEAISSAIAVHLRSLEAADDQDDDDVDDKDGKDKDAAATVKEATYLKWSEIVEWYLEQIEKEEIGDSLERLHELRKKINLVVRRLLNVDKVLVTVGGEDASMPKNKRQEQQTVLAVHPNYVIS